jgi:hypothetical protein
MTDWAKKIVKRELYSDALPFVKETALVWALEKARNDTLEEAAKVAESKWEDTGDHIAAAIRDLKEKP